MSPSANREGALLLYALGARMELDPAVLTANPVPWHRLETGAGRARANGPPVAGDEVLREVRARRDEDGARAILANL
ncbi:hypothetical protein ABZ930_20940 [Streptomyces sp. NPDC046716]|uniref:hypothetical protein n=1 Tax=Streptomyces sp. NPDC046716 TaxID=3157093 RepID=UPI0033DF1EF7